MLVSCWGLLVTILEALGAHFGSQNASDSATQSFLDRFLKPSWFHFGSQNGFQNLPKSSTNPSKNNFGQKNVNFWKIAPRLHEKLIFEGPVSQKPPKNPPQHCWACKTYWSISICVLLIFRALPEPLLGPRTPTMDSPKIDFFSTLIFDRFLEPKWTQNGWHLEPKIHPKSIQNQIDFLIDF